MLLTRPGDIKGNLNQCGTHMIKHETPFPSFAIPIHSWCASPKLIPLHICWWMHPRSWKRSWHQQCRTQPFSQCCRGLQEVYPSICPGGYHGHLPVKPFGWVYVWNSWNRSRKIWSHWWYFKTWISHGKKWNIPLLNYRNRWWWTHLDAPGTFLGASGTKAGEPREKSTETPLTEKNAIEGRLVVKNQWDLCYFMFTIECWKKL